MDKIIESIEINIGGTTVKVTPDQARKLLAALQDLLGEKETIYIPSSPQYVPVPQYPVNPWQPLYPWVTYCDASATITLS